VSLRQVVVLALLFGTFSAVDNPARQAFVAEVVGRDLIRSAATLNSTAVNVARVIGPAIAAAGQYRGPRLVLHRQRRQFLLRHRLIAAAGRPPAAPGPAGSARRRAVAGRAAVRGQSPGHCPAAAHDGRDRYLHLRIRGQPPAAGPRYLHGDDTTYSWLIASDPAYRGRVTALWSLALVGSTPIGSPIIGTLSQLTSPRWALALGAAACGVATTIGQRALPPQSQADPSDAEPVSAAS
jgi:MFS family permease